MPATRRHEIKTFSLPTVSTSTSARKPGDPEPVTTFGLERLVAGPTGSLIGLFRALTEEAYYHAKLAQDQRQAPPSLLELVMHLQAVVLDEMHRRAAGEPPTPSNPLPSYVEGGEWSAVEQALMADFDIMPFLARHGVDIAAFQLVDDIFAGPCPFAKTHQHDGLLFVDPAARLWFCTGCDDGGDPRWFVVRKLVLSPRDLLTFFEVELGLRDPADHAAYADGGTAGIAHHPGPAALSVPIKSGSELNERSPPSPRQSTSFALFASLTRLPSTHTHVRLASGEWRDARRARATRR